MKSHIRCLFFALLSAAAVLGCKTIPKTALTPAMLERMKKLSNYDITKYKFYLSDPFVLSYVKTDAGVKSIKGKKGKRGVIFENNILNTNITFKNKIRGEALLLQESGDEILLRVYFEDKKYEAAHPAATHYLVFSAKKSDKNGFFYLKYDSGSGRFMLSDEKGILTYNGDPYHVIFVGGTPYLLIWLDQQMEVKDINRVILGRDGKSR
jgi:hypothetical protein